ncbi:MAG: hypothetical protein KIG65_00475 [Eubacteriales bacterium]|nr:hypothetical protein [Eubacteriales bacterium]
MTKVIFTLKAPQKIIRERGLGVQQEVQKLIDSEILSRCKPYVPKKSGALIDSGNSSTKIGSGIVSYNMPYAAYQYYGVSNNGKKLRYTGAPTRGSYWFERMKAVDKDTILRLAADKAGATPLLSTNTKENNKNKTIRADSPKSQAIKTVFNWHTPAVFAFSD